MVKKEGVELRSYCNFDRIIDGAMNFSYLLPGIEEKFSLSSQFKCFTRFDPAFVFW